MNAMEHLAMLDAESEMGCALCLFTNVQNTEELRKKIADGELSCCFIKAALIHDPFQVVVAANKAAVNATLYKKMTTKNLHTEILFCLSTSKNITRSLTEFGIGPDDKNIVVAVVRKVETEDSLNTEFLNDVVQGEKIPIFRVSEFTDLELVKKTYNIDDQEWNECDRTDSIISRIS